MTAHVPGNLLQLRVVSSRCTSTELFPECTGKAIYAICVKYKMMAEGSLDEILRQPLGVESSPPTLGLVNPAAIRKNKKGCGSAQTAKCQIHFLFQTWQLFWKVVNQCFFTSKLTSTSVLNFVMKFLSNC